MVRGHLMSPEMSPFDKASYSTLIETIGLHLLHSFRVIASHLLKVAHFNLPHLHFVTR